MRISVTAALAMTAALVAGTVSGCGSANTSGGEAAFPAKGKTVTLVVPFDAGGITDVLARLLGPELEKSLGTNVTIRNLPGAGGQTGLTRVVSEKPDGYTLTFTNLPSVLTYLDPARKTVYKRESFTPLAGIALSPTVFAVRKDSPLQDIEDMVTKSQQSPGSVNVGSGGSVASDDYLAAAGLEEAANVDLNIVTFGAGRRTS
ncbi:tripartite tricarboxylate transporter substrate-binding protein [Micromonospora pallida]|uniref:tripartite tricarboxylate transporter substrate-binding protein n=1 Tax=Micromonospora pallida TaxID=145854 RepID=UPI000B83160D|nr:tripartite tricarboxylate transporter substrate-binding protein [Micromonospora pallida]